MQLAAWHFPSHLQLATHKHEFCCVGYRSNSLNMASSCPKLLDLMALLPEINQLINKVFKYLFNYFKTFTQINTDNIFNNYKNHS